MFINSTSEHYWGAAYNDDTYLYVVEYDMNGLVPNIKSMFIKENVEVFDSDFPFISLYVDASTPVINEVGGNTYLETSYYYVFSYHNLLDTYYTASNVRRGNKWVAVFTSDQGQMDFEDYLDTFEYGINFTTVSAFNVIYDYYSEYQMGYDDGFDEGHQNGLESGYASGKSVGIIIGRDDVLNNPNLYDLYTSIDRTTYGQQQRELGESIGYADGYDDGDEDGYARGYDEGKQDGFTEGAQLSQEDAYNEGYGVGSQNAFLNSLQYWFPSAILLVLIGGGILYMIKRKNGVE